jgi:hypothetical protein
LLIRPITSEQLRGFMHQGQRNVADCFRSVFSFAHSILRQKDVSVNFLHEHAGS